MVLMYPELPRSLAKAMEVALNMLRLLVMEHGRSIEGKAKDD
jgi:hypothetical protein